MQIYQLGQRFDASGNPLNGGKAYFYESGTTTPVTMYEDAGLSLALSHPIVATSAGYFPEAVYNAGTDELRLVITNSTGATTTVDADPVNVPEASGGINGNDIVTGSIPGDALEPGAVDDALGFSPQEDLTALTPTAKNALLDRVGMVFPFFGTSPPAGSLKCNGATIGSAASGATNAHADYAALFALLWAWDNTASPILDSLGAPSTRGANAAADFAANKRLTLPDLRGEFIRGLDDSRGVDTGRAIGRAQAGQMPEHSHSYATVRTDIGSGGQSVTGATGSGSTTGNTGGTENTSENRPRNIALLYAVYY